MAVSEERPRDREWTVLVNPRARRGGRTAGGIERALARSGVRAEVILTGSAEEVRARARQAAGREVVVAVLGGDGTANDAASQLIGGKAWFAHIPGGGENLIARASGAGPDPFLAIGLLLDGRARQWDVGLLGDKPFLGFAGVGFDGEVCDRAEAARGTCFGAAAFWSAAALGLFSRPLRFKVTWDSGELGDCHEAVVSNIPVYGGNLRMNPRADPGDGKLDLAAFRWGGYFNRARQLLSLSSLCPEALPVPSGIERVRVTRVTVSADRPLPAQVDGNPVRLEDFSVSVRAAAVWVIESRARL